MVMSLFGYWWAVIKRAFGGTFWLAEKWSGGIALVYGAFVYVMHLTGTWEAAVTWVPFAVFAAVFVATVAVGLFVAPWQMHKEHEAMLTAAKAKIDALQSATAPEPPNLETLDQYMAFSLWDAAWLWVNQKPLTQGRPFTLEARKAFDDLEAAIGRRDLDVVNDNVRDVAVQIQRASRDGTAFQADPTWHVTRWDLVGCANAIGAKPKFLFPRERV